LVPALSLEEGLNVGLEKSDIKIGTINEIGSALDDLLEAALTKAEQAEGGKVLAKKGLAGIESILSAIDRDLDEGKFDEPPDGPLKQAALIKRWVLRCDESLKNLLMQAEGTSLQTEGRVAGLKAAVEIAQKRKTAEVSKARALQEAIERGAIIVEDAPDGENGGRPVGAHPAQHSAAADIQQRREEAKADKEAKAKAEAKASNGAKNGKAKTAKKKTTKKKTTKKRASAEN